MVQAVALVRGRVVDDVFQMTLHINGKPVHPVVLDTGAATLILNGEIARRLHLPNLGAIQVVGVGGAASAFRSKCDLKLGNRLFRDVPCVVIKRFSKQGLLGLKFFRDNQLGIMLNPRMQTLRVYRT
ncbi:retropepsin-like aspartic protease [Alicyclobacillus ferrooxydans]|uniref:Peptidase A2 domain-containing protein n=1 Tax=Alicyclobacillus ferrooxydans TaxID=471514 RepID=A0A0P9F1H9_9BACL|nr:retropepsin-like aspartic protease [Alicyclobacillus ferrooxydans]KPV45238.1 hypothetical protein AN477_02210 [Alicyclobacillus ferrooxydans]